jgi:hypothetical protein
MAIDNKLVRWPAQLYCAIYTEIINMQARTMARFPPTKWECLPIDGLDQLLADLLEQPADPTQLRAVAFMAIR